MQEQHRYIYTPISSSSRPRRRHTTEHRRRQRHFADPRVSRRRLTSRDIFSVPTIILDRELHAGPLRRRVRLSERKTTEQGRYDNEPTNEKYNESEDKQTIVGKNAANYKEDKHLARGVRYDSKDSELFPAGCRSANYLPHPEAPPPRGRVPKVPPPGENGRARWGGGQSRPPVDAGKPATPHLLSANHSSYPGYTVSGALWVRASTALTRNSRWPRKSPHRLYSLREIRSGRRCERKK